METLRSNVKTSTSAVSVYMTQVYQWMTAGLFTTGAVAWYVSGSAELMSLLMGNTISLVLLVILLIGLPLGLQGMLPRLSSTTATLWFLLYSAVMGVALSSIFIVYTGASIASTFFITAGTFGAMSIYGMVTKRDLTGMGSFLMMGLIGLIIAMVVNIFLKSPAMNFAISCIGVLIFTGLTAYDTQKIRAFGENAPISDATALRRGSILGALTLYLDFINLFMMLLRLLGDRR